MALWGFTVISILVGYRPPKRHPQVEHLSLMAKVKRLDIPGMLLVRLIFHLFARRQGK